MIVASFGVPCAPPSLVRAALVSPSRVLAVVAVSMDALSGPAIPAMLTVMEVALVAPIASSVETLLVAVERIIGARVAVLAARKDVELLVVATLVIVPPPPCALRAAPAIIRLVLALRVGRLAMLVGMVPRAPLVLAVPSPVGNSSGAVSPTVVLIILGLEAAKVVLVLLAATVRDAVRVVVLVSVAPVTAGGDVLLRRTAEPVELLSPWDRQYSKPQQHS